MIYTFVLVVALSAGSACPFEDLSVEAGVVRWGGLRLGMSEAEVTGLVGESLTLEPNEARTGSSSARVELDGVRLSLWFRNTDGALVGVTSWRSEGESDECWSRAALVDQVKSTFPHATYRPSRHAPELAEDANKTNAGGDGKPSGTGFAVIDRWRLREGSEAQFEEAWATVTRLTNGRSRPAPRRSRGPEAWPPVHEVSRRLRLPPGSP